MIYQRDGSGNLAGFTWLSFPDFPANSVKSTVKIKFQGAASDFFCPESGIRAIFQVFLIIPDFPANRNQVPDGFRNQESGARWVPESGIKGFAGNQEVIRGFAGKSRDLQENQKGICKKFLASLSLICNFCFSNWSTFVVVAVWVKKVR